MQIRAWFSTISLGPVTGCKCDRSWPPRLAARQHGAAPLQKIGQDAPGSAVFLPGASQRSRCAAGGCLSAGTRNLFHTNRFWSTRTGNQDIWEGKTRMMRCTDPSASSLCAEIQQRACSVNSASLFPLTLFLGHPWCSLTINPFSQPFKQPSTLFAFIRSPGPNAASDEDRAWF